MAPHRFSSLLPIAAMVVAMASCAEPDPRGTPARSCDVPAAREVALRFGEQLRRVSLQAPDSVVEREMREAYAPLVTPELLEAWIADPARAPGRQVSSPWPERIEVRAVEAESGGSCRVEGEVVQVTSVELARGGSAARDAVTLRVVDDGGWRVSAYETAPASVPDPATTPDQPSDVIRRYYAAIDAHDYRTAYELWEDGGRASGQSFEEFAAGFAQTASVDLEVGEPGRVEGAAGSRYVEVPVVVRAETADGGTQRFEGTYTLRRSVVGGDSEEQRRWHIHSAEVARAR